MNPDFQQTHFSLTAWNVGKNGLESTRLMKSLACFDRCYEKWIILIQLDQFYPLEVEHLNNLFYREINDKKVSSHRRSLFMRTKKPKFLITQRKGINGIKILKNEKITEIERNESAVKYYPKEKKNIWKT